MSGFAWRIGLAGLLTLPAVAFGSGFSQFFGAMPSGPKNERVPGYILVKYTQSAAKAIAENKVLQVMPPRDGFPAAKFVNKIGPSGWIMWKVADDVDTVRLAASIRPGGDIIAAQPLNKIYPLLATPNDGDYNYIETDENLIFTSDEEDHSFRRLWHLDEINAVAGWSVWPNRWYTAANKPRNAVSLAIIDTGCDMDHPDFANAGNPSTDSANGGQLDKANSAQFKLGEVDPLGDTDDTNGHGTHVAGLAVAAGNNGSFNGHGVIGSGYPAKAMILRVFDDSGNGSDADAAAAMFYAADKGAAVINLSLGTTNFSQLFQDAVTYATQKGTLVICAGNESGNGGGDLGPIYPAACSGALAVTANGPDFMPATTNYTGTGSYLSIAAPGGDVVFGAGFTWFKIQYDFSTAPRVSGAINQNTSLVPPFTLDYAYLAGTSMACPLVSGASTLWYGRYGQSQASGWANIRAYQAIQRSAQSLLGAPNGGWEPTQGYGCLDLQALVTQSDPRAATVGTLNGIVYYNGTAISNVAVKAKRATSPVVYQTTTQADGTFRFDQLPPSNYTVWAAPFGSYKQKHLNVKTGCDMPGVDLWCGTFTGDETAPVVAKARAYSVGTNNVTIDHFAYDTETGLDKIMIQIGTSLGASNLRPPIEIWPNGSNLYYVPNMNFQPGGTYWCRLTYTNGAGANKSVDFSFQRPL